MLDRLAQAGHRFAVCTNKLERLSKRLLDTLQPQRPLCRDLRPDTFGVHKPDPQMFRATVLKAGGDPKRAVMVGDSSDRHPHRPRRRTSR